MGLIGANGPSWYLGSTTVAHLPSSPLATTPAPDHQVQWERTLAHSLGGQEENHNNHNNNKNDDDDNNNKKNKKKMIRTIRIRIRNII